MRTTSPLLARWACLLAVLLSFGCNRAHFARAGDQAWRDDRPAEALASWRESLRREGKILSPRERMDVKDSIARAVERLAQPAMRAATAATARGDGERALDILLPLFAGKGLFDNLDAEHLNQARRRLMQPIREALTVAAGIDVAALESGAAIEEAGAKIKSLAKRLEIVRSSDRRELEQMLDDLATPALNRGWTLVQRLLERGRTVEGCAFADRVASVRPNDQTQQARRKAAYSQALQAQRALLAKVPASMPGLRWAAGELVRRFGGSGEGQIVDELRRVQYQVGNQAVCTDLGSALGSALRRGSSGVLVTVDVEVPSCSARERSWQTRERVNWTEVRERDVPYVERYTEYVSRQQCKYVQVYANTTCSSYYAGNGVTKQTCRDNYSTMQRCSTVSEPVTRERRGVRRERYQVQRTTMRVNSHYAAAFSASGRVTLRWPGGETSLPISFSDSSQDYGYSDEAGSRRANVTSISSMKSSLVAGVARQVHGHDAQALRPKAIGLRNEADAAYAQQAKELGLDRALQAHLLGISLRSQDVALVGAWLELPPSVAASPGSWGSASSQVAIRGEEGGTAQAAAARTNADSGKRSGGLGALFGGQIDDDATTPVERLVDPRLPRPDRALVRTYEELRGTAFDDEREFQRSQFTLRSSVGSSPLDAGRLGLGLGAQLTLEGAVRLDVGGDLERADLGTRSFWFGLAIGTFRDEQGGQFGVHARYGRYDLAARAGSPLPSVSTARSMSALDFGLSGRIGEHIGLLYDINLNALAWLGDDKLAHYHKQSLGLFVRVWRVQVEGSAQYWLGGGGFRWNAAVAFAF